MDDQIISQPPRESRHCHRKFRRIAIFISSLFVLYFPRGKMRTTHFSTSEVFFSHRVVFSSENDTRVRLSRAEIVAQLL